MPDDRPYTFGGFRLDTANEQLWQGPQSVALRPKPFAVLTHLVEHAGQLVTKQQLLDAVWPGTFVSDAVLKDSIRQVRDALGDDAASPQFIETAHRRGYRFIGRFAEELAAAPAPSHQRDGDRSDAAVAARATTVLGREAELAIMDGCIERALRGERQIVFVTGEPGIGKTTLVSAVRDMVTTRGMWLAWGQCLEHYGAGEAYLPVLDGLSRLGRTAAGGRLTELLHQHAPTWLLELPSLIPAAEREAMRPQAMGATRERMLREFAEAIEAMTTETALMIVLEDLHWSDYSTLDLISYLARRRDRARLLVIGTYRPVDVIVGEHALKVVKRELQAHGLCRELPLEYLTQADVEQYLAVTLPGQQLPRWLARLIHRRTEGNPLFMVNLVEYLLAKGIIVKHGDDWLLHGGFADIDSGVPENVRQLIEAHIDRLSADERLVLEGASVVGMECSSVAIAAGLEKPTEWVEQYCEALVRRYHFLSPPRLVELPDGTITPRYKFNHILYLEVPYRLIAAMRRAHIHRRIGHSGEVIYRERVGEIAAELAMHFEQGKDASRAVRYLLLAAENARHRSAHHEARALARRGLSALAALAPSPQRDEQELSLRMILGLSVMSLKGFADDEVRDIYERAIELGGGQHASPQAFMAQWLLGLFHYFRAEMRRCDEIARQLVDVAGRLPDPLYTSEAACAFGVTLVELGRFGASLDRFDQVALLSKGQPERQTRAFAGQDPAVTSECYAARALWALGYPDRALVRIGRARELIDSCSPAETRVVAIYFAAHLHQLRGEPGAAQEQAESAIALADDYGLSLWVALAHIIRGWARLEQGSVDDGTNELRRGLAAYDATGARIWRAQSLGYLAQALAKSGRFDEGLAAVSEALTLIRETGEDGSAADLHRVQGELLLGRASGERLPAGVATHVEECLTRALTISRAQEARSWELKALTSLARFYSHQGEKAVAMRLVKPALEWFTEGLDTADLRAARAILNEASGRTSRSA